MTRLRTYSELKRLSTLEDRFEYLQLGGQVGVATFGFDRWINQSFYTSREWRRVRDQIISRDVGMDLGVEGHEIYDRVIIHHMNPMTVDDLVHGEEDIINPEYLITTTLKTHNAIHYGDARLLPQPMVQRRAGDTKLW